MANPNHSNPLDRDGTSVEGVPSRIQSQHPLASELRSTLDVARSVVDTLVAKLDSQLRDINQKIHSHPETAWQEHYAHDTITAFLEQQGFNVKRHTYGFDTSFEAEYGQGGRLIVVCCEYDALPQIGHACGHNLIATSSITTFLAVAEVIKQSSIPGRVRILGTPAEEGGGGKAKLIDAGAFSDDIAAAIMAHPTSARQILRTPGQYTGLAGFKLIASHKFRTEFRGKPAHAAGEPWNGLNALDAAVAAYNNVALLRQQMEPDERVHGVIENGGTVPNVITDYTKMNWNVRSPTIDRADKLLTRVKACLEAAALSTGCKLEYIVSPTYLNLRANQTLCETYAQHMEALGSKVLVNQDKEMNASTDMGNVSFKVPSFHGAFIIPTEPDVAGHHPGFAAAAATSEAHEAATKCARGMSMLAVQVLVDDDVARGAKSDFESPDE